MHRIIKAENKLYCDANGLSFTSTGICVNWSLALTFCARATVYNSSIYCDDLACENIFEFANRNYFNFEVSSTVDLLMRRMSSLPNLILIVKFLIFRGLFFNFDALRILVLNLLQYRLLTFYHSLTQDSGQNNSPVLLIIAIAVASTSNGN